MGCFERLPSSFKRHLARLRPGRHVEPPPSSGLKIGSPYAFRHLNHTGPQDSEALMNEKLAYNYVASDQHLITAPPPSSTTSRQPTLYESSCDVRDTRVRWADGNPEEQDEDQSKNMI